MKIKINENKNKIKSCHFVKSQLWFWPWGAGAAKGSPIQAPSSEANFQTPLDTCGFPRPVLILQRAPEISVVSLSCQPKDTDQ